MLLSEYLTQIVEVIHNFSKANLVIGSELKNDFRTEKDGIIRGTIIFIDESVLHFTEYLDARFKIEKLTYSYHYQKANGELVFRYDNAEHKPKLHFKDHKHLSSGALIPSDPPDLKDLFTEITDRLL